MSINRNKVSISETIELETEIVLPEADPNRVVVLCHPHPLYGGNMDNYVIGLSSNKLNGSGIATVKFNFRGVGGSSGTFSHGDGELLDTLGIIEHVQSSSIFSGRNIAVGLLGYSFGARVALFAANKYKGSASLALISPPTIEEGFTFPNLDIPKLLVAGEQDQFDAAKSVQSLEMVLPKPSEVKVYSDDHFWGIEIDKMTTDVTKFFVDSFLKKS